MDVKNVFIWFFDIFKSLPQGFVTTIINSFITMYIIKLLSWIGNYSKIIGDILKKIQKVLRWNSEIKATYTVISTPVYSLNLNKKNVEKTPKNNSYLIWIIIIALVLSILALNFLKAYQSDVQTVIYGLSLFFIGSGVGLIITSKFTNKIQRSTLNFSIFGIALSFYTYYIASLIPELTSRIPDEMNLSMMFSDSINFWTLIYMLFGMFLLFLEVLFVISLFLRMFVIKIDSLKSLAITRYLISKTSHFDSALRLTILLIILTILSYLFTTGIMIDCLFKFSDLS